MCGFIFFILLLIFKINGQVTEQEKVQLLKLCEVCTCSEIPDFDGTHLVFNIQCSELDRIESVADLDKIEWPPNPNGLEISAAFEGLGLSTLGKLPPNSQIETLRFSNNAIKTYWPDPFNDVPNLKKLSFAQNDLTEITPDLFTNIDNLQDLDLSYNKLSDFNALDFKNLHGLKRFSCQNNQLKKIPLEALQPMAELEDLDLSKNGIYDLLLHKGDNDVLKNLKRLYLSGNRIRSVMKDSFPDNNSIELLDLSNNIIEIVEPDAFLTCTNLRELNLAQNNITLIFDMPPALQIAILKINTLYHWPSFPSGITYIDLSYNRLSSLYDENKVNFDNLEVLNLGGNQIKEVNIAKKLPKLFSLDLSYNVISDIPKSLNSQFLPNIEDLRLDGNPIQSIYFKNIIALKNLYMNELHNLEVVDEKAFSNVIGRSGEENDGNCFSLFLSNCPSLNEIRDGAFDGTTLCMLDVSKNNLSHISETLLVWSTLSEGANLQFNPWACTCDLQWVIEGLLPQMYRINSRLLTEFRCASPRPFEGLRLVHFYNWTEQAMCDQGVIRTGRHGSYQLEASSESSDPKWTSLTLILSACIIIGLLIAIGLCVYLIKTRRRYKVRQAAMKRKRQSALDAKNSNGTQKEQFSALNRT